MKNDNFYMQRCLDLALNGNGNVAPNPMVGSVIVYNDSIIGEGYHAKYGQAHAEVNAINNVKNKEVLKKSKLYVNLEPCAHFGKTPPCADLIIKHEIPEVIIGCIDTNLDVAGKGAAKLKNAGCNVKIGILENESRELNKRFFTFHEKKRPYIILKWAQTLDGFIDIKRDFNQIAKPNWITNDKLKMLVHKWRTQEQAIMIGTNTALKDNPSLNARDWFGNSPLRFVIDRNLKIPLSFNVFNQPFKTVVFTEKDAKSIDNIEYVVIDFNQSIIEQVLLYLYNKKIQSLFVEGGSILLNSFIEKNLWDEARVFIGNKLFQNGISAPKINNNYTSKEFIEEDQLITYKNPYSISK